MSALTGSGCPAPAPSGLDQSTALTVMADAAIFSTFTKASCLVPEVSSCLLQLGQFQRVPSTAVDQTLNFTRCQIKDTSERLSDRVCQEPRVDQVVGI
ncbi:hypothetical protein PGQ11_014975 [Apiospora arundinis]|uniref:Uncharacterized protein n=1 Tax=Apiospora arundinis TaxID=335852 RepID=A0ABR2HJY4_9PEZI